MPCGITKPCHVSSDIPRLEKREIPTTSESNEIRHGYQISRDDFNGEVRFVIRDLEKFWIFTEMRILPLFEKIGFSRGFTSSPIPDCTRSLMDTISASCPWDSITLLNKDGVAAKLPNVPCACLLYCNTNYPTVSSIRHSREAIPTNTPHDF